MLHKILSGGKFQNFKMEECRRPAYMNALVDFLEGIPPQTKKIYEKFFCFIQDAVMTSYTSSILKCGYDKMGYTGNSLSNVEGFDVEKILSQMSSWGDLTRYE